MNLILISYLLINAWTDWKRKEIDLIYTLIFVVVGMVYKLSTKDIYNWYGILPGLILLLFSFVCKNHIGRGDGIIVMSFGWLCGLTQVCDVLVGGFLLAACGGILCWIRGKGKKMELPFVPFFFGSYLIELWVKKGFL